MAEESGICNILVKSIDYSCFRTKEEDRIVTAAGSPGRKGEFSLWENFVHGLIDGTLDPNGDHTACAGTLDPGMLAEMMNDLNYHSVIKMVSYSETIASFVEELDKRVRFQMS